MKKFYNKLVRDKIPQICIGKNEMPKTKILNNDEYLIELNKKLLEETNEYLQSGEVEELADIEEVLLAILKAKGVDFENFDKIRKTKVEKRGAFNDKIFLISVEE